MKRSITISLCFVAIFVISPAIAETITFEGFSDLTVLTNQIPGVTFSNATVLTSGAVGGSLNEIDFPPFSGVNVAGDEGGPMSLVFASPVVSFSGRFTYNTALTVSAFDISDVLLGSASSLFPENFGTSATGNPPNELISLANPGIAKIVIMGDPSGGSFVLDDATFQTAAAVPEPTTLLLFATGFSILLRRRNGQ